MMKLAFKEDELSQDVQPGGREASQKNTVTD